jgi:hypothetical protein
MKRRNQSGIRSVLAAKLSQGMCLGLLAAGFGMPAFALAQASPGRVDFGQEPASDAAHQVADWVIDANNNRGLPFLIIDKTDAKAYVFHADGRLRGAAPVLLGLAIGDDSVTGIGDRTLASIRPEERTTPAGRFVAALGRNLQGVKILWVDYENAISLHPAITSNPEEQRAERLATPSAADNRISYGCINVSAAFFKRVVSAAFKGTNGIVYVLPETRSAQQQFGSYEPQARAQWQTPSHGSGPATR